MAYMQGGVCFGLHRLHFAASISRCAVTRDLNPGCGFCRELDVSELESLLSKIAQRIRLGLTTFRAVRVFCSPLAPAMCMLLLSMWCLAATWAWLCVFTACCSQVQCLQDPTLPIAKALATADSIRAEVPHQLCTSSQAQQHVPLTH